MASIRRPSQIQFGHSSSSAKSSGPPPLGLPGPAEQVVRRTLRGHTGEVSVRVFNPGQHGADLRVLAIVSRDRAGGDGGRVDGTRMADGRTRAAPAEDDHERSPRDIRHGPAPAARAHRPRRRVQGAGRHLRRAARTARRVLPLPAAVRRQRLPRAAYSARAAQDAGAGHAGGSQRHSGVAARRPRTRARLRGAARAADRGAPQSRRRRAGARPARAGRPDGGDTTRCLPAAVPRSSAVAYS